MILKHIFDRLASFFALIAFSWLFLLIALVIKIVDGSVLFKQERIGRHGVPFVIYKFRTMKLTHNGSSISVEGESRITPLGSFLRKYKLDELPELWNVLKGDMSFVGPRPDVSGYADKLEGDDRAILSVRPGITGPATLKYRNEEHTIAMFLAENHLMNGWSDEQIVSWYNDTILFPDKVRLNRFYVEHNSLGMDLKMIICTIFHLHMKYNGEII